MLKKSVSIFLVVMLLLTMGLSASAVGGSQDINYNANSSSTHLEDTSAEVNSGAKMSSGVFNFFKAIL
ncbi:hypothetical protein C814_02600 [Anaerotruncus sp. G3(2012)]|nr:hypothetical protein C814_02600 [Anaerotruncus sp. G3(2012)]